MYSLRQARLLMMIVGLSMGVFGSSSASVPGLMSYQGTLKSSGGVPLNGTYSMTFSIYALPSSGVALWTETQGVVVVKEGNFAVSLGSVNPLSDAVFQASALYLGVKIGADSELSPRRQLSSVGYAFRVNTVDGATGGNIEGSTFIDGNTTISGTMHSLDVNAAGEILGPEIVGNPLYGGVAITGTSESSVGYENTGVRGFGTNGRTWNVGVYGTATDADLAPLANCAGIYGQSQSLHGGTIWAGYFEGWTAVVGNFYASAKFFRIDDPQLPAERTLTHSCVESNEYKNFYDGVITLDDNGESVVTLPDWFDGLNTEFRYQLTCIGGYAQVYIASEVSNNRFSIAGGKPGLKVSWQITGIRKDAYAVAHPFKVVEDKPAELRGKYLHPKELGVSEELGVDYPMQKYSEEQHKAAAGRAKNVVEKPADNK